MLSRAFESMSTNAVHRRTLLGSCLLLGLLCWLQHLPASYADFTFGTGVNQFTISTVAIGDLSNTADIETTYTGIGAQSLGAVAYQYEMSKYEITRGMINQYNNQNGSDRDVTMYLYTPADSNDTLYSSNSYVNGDSNQGFKDTLPATGISYIEATQFVNWLNTSSGYSAAYNLDTNGQANWQFWDVNQWAPSDAGYDASDPYRNANAKFFLMNADEAYKAAFYDTNSTNYFDYTVGSDTAPTSYDGTAGVFQGTDADKIVKGGNVRYLVETDQTGGTSQYGVMSLGGSAGDMIETTDGIKYNLFGGTLAHTSIAETYAHSSSLIKSYNIDATELSSQGFRIVTTLQSPAPIPEPNTVIAVGLLGIVGFVGNRRRRRHASDT